jgi:hypothetical protein
MATADEDRVRRIEDLVRRLDAIPDRESRESARELLQAILELQGAALERIMELVFDSGEAGKAAIRRFAADSLVASLLVLHGLHPDDLETRVQHALTKAHANADLLGVFEGVVRVRLTSGACGLKESVAALLAEAIPDAAEIVVEEYLPSNGFVSLTSLGVTIPRIA